jgi:hypothetical protein
VAERHDDLGPPGLIPQELQDPAAHRRRRVGDDCRNPLGVEEDHPRPADRLAPAVGGFEGHHEEISFVIERVLPVTEVGQRFEAEGLEQLEVFLSPLEGLLHRDHPVAEHSCLSHEEFSVHSFQFTVQSLQFSVFRFQFRN